MVFPRLKRVAVAIAGVTVLLVSGCGATDPAPADGEPSAAGAKKTAAPAAPTSEAVTVEPSDTAATERDYDKCGPGTQRFNGAAADEFGAANVSEAHCTFVELSMEHGFEADLMKKDRGFTASDFSFWREYMTPGARTDWDQAVDKIVVDPDDAAASVIWGLTWFHTAGGSGYSFVKDSAVVLDKTFSSATTAVDLTTGEPRLSLTFTISADANLMKDGKLVPVNLSKDLSLYLVRNLESSQKMWLIGGWKASFNIDKPQ